MWNRSDDQESVPASPERLPGVIDTIGIGYETLLSRPWLIVPPVLLDLYLWLGVHITSRPLSLSLAGWLRKQDLTSGRVASFVEDTWIDNVTELAVLRMPSTRLPSFVSTLSGDAWRLEQLQPSLSIGSWSVVALGLLMLVVGLLIASEYLQAIASAVCGLKRAPGAGAGRGAIRLASWYLVIGALALLVFWPVLAGLVASEMAGAGTSVWLFLLLFLPASWAFVLFFFSIQAMFIDQSGPLQALRSSYRVVRNDSWNALGMIVAYVLLTTGFPQVWRMLIEQPAGVAVAIVGHAIISTGVIAATMVFYRDRMRRISAAGHA
jgi:hypothetical protein